MNKLLKQTFTILYLFLFLGFQTKTNAQVTIGISEKAQTGALLDLKQFNDAEALAGGRNANKGLLLPRVKLNSKTIAPANNGNLATTIDGANTSTNWNKDEHTGMLVYHISGNTKPQCAHIIDGIYVWSGNEWMPLFNKNASGGAVLATLTLKNGTIALADGQMVDIMSGNDERGTAIPDLMLNIAWTGSTLTLTPTGEIGGNLSNPSAMITTQGWVSGADVVIPNKYENKTISFADMTSLLTSTNRWKSREWKLKVKVVDDCDTELIQTIILNQTNYAIGVTDVSSSTYKFDNYSLSNILNDTNAKTLNLRSNTGWTATIGGDKPAIITSSTLADGALKKDGSYVQTSFSFTPQILTGGKYEKATITFTDNVNSPKAAKDIVVTVQSCLGTEDMSSVTTVANNSETEVGSASWSGKVVHHTAKMDGGDIIYNDFYSADFGAAGRWMITNLETYRYDLNGAPIRSFYTGGDMSVFNSLGVLTLHPANTTTTYNKAYYTYPGADRIIANNETPSPEFVANPRLGLLYSWDAATAGKGGADGYSQNIDNPASGHPANNESGFFPKGANGGVNEEVRRQGICPKGWHLPNDYEWTELEQEIIKDTDRYADMENINPTGTSGNNWVEHPSPGSTGSVGSYEGTHGLAMKDVCEPYLVTTYRGTSNKISKGGFSVLLAGNVLGTGKVGNFAKNARFWTNSSVVVNNSYSRYLSCNSGGINRSQSSRAYLLSVRCKKD